MSTETYQKWLSQLRKGFLELCVMTAINRKKSSYGFELLQVINQAGLEINEGSLYPLLNRLDKNGWLESHWETPVDGGHPRRFYQLSRVGKKQLADMIESNEQQNNCLERLQELT